MWQKDTIPKLWPKWIPKKLVVDKLIPKKFHQQLKSISEQRKASMLIDKLIQQVLDNK